jgi:transcriptional regulator with XRE-family HTH domain
MNGQTMTKAELARVLGVSRTYVTLLTQGKKKPSKEMADRFGKIRVDSQPERAYKHVFEHTHWAVSSVGRAPDF